MADKKQKKEETAQKTSKPKGKKEEVKTESSKESKVKIPIRLFDYYRAESISYLMKTFSYKNVMQVQNFLK